MNAKLRFDISGKLEQYKFDDIASIKSKKFNPETAVKSLPCIELEHLSQETGEILGTISSDKIASQKNCFDIGNVLFSKLRPYLKKYALPDFSGVCSSEIWVMTPSEHVISEFLFQLVQSSRFVAGANKSSGSKMPRADWKVVAELMFLIPEKEEQQKIADFLTSVDTKISQLTEKHRLLKEYKKGVMQQIFSQQISFRDEDDKAFPEWEEKHLIDIADPIKRKADNVIDNVMTVSAGKGFLHQKERFSQVIAGTSLDKYTHLKKGEFSYNRGNSKSFKYGCIYPLIEDEALVPFVYRSFKLKSGVSNFYAQLFANKYLDRQLRRLISSSARMDGLLNIGEKDFYQVTLPVPSEDEQQKIAKFLQSIDKKIGAVAEQIKQTKQFKKGLLQQMFV